MWRFNLFGFPVTVEPWFWLVSFLMGGGIEARGREGFTLVAIWIAVVFVSIMVHELGHALAGRRFGAHPEIGLHGMGGVAVMHGGYFTRWQSIFVSAAGPLASLASSRSLRSAAVSGAPATISWTSVCVCAIACTDSNWRLKLLTRPPAKM